MPSVTGPWAHKVLGSISLLKEEKTAAMVAVALELVMWCIPVIPALRRPSQGDLEFDYVLHSKTV